jgi:hypothetical protein
MEFKKNKDWNKNKIKQMAKRLKISMAKVYKWHWEKKRIFRNEE